MTDHTALLAEAEKAAHAVYLACAEPVALDLARLLDSLAAALRECYGISLQDQARIRTLVETRVALRAQVAKDHARCERSGIVQCDLDGQPWPCAVRVRLGIAEEDTP